VCSAAIIAPFEMYFQTLGTAYIISSAIQSPWENQLLQLRRFVSYFMRNELLLTGLVIKTTFVILWFRNRRKAAGDTRLMHRVKVILLLNAFFVVYGLVITRSPLFLYTRSFISLQPIWILSAICEFTVCCRFLRNEKNSVAAKGAIYSIGIATFILYLIMQSHLFKGHVRELCTPYRGPLDFIIPEIRSIFPQTDTLVIAVDYESTSFMFYLNAKVLIGYVPIDVHEDMKFVPDIIVYRQPFLPQKDMLNKYLKKAEYDTKYFNVLNYPVNNIPELNGGPEELLHLFETPYSDNREKQAFMLVKRSSIPFQ
jgi:hypothetical protein